MLNIVLIGGPGAGKGTQARLLYKRLGIPHIASGDLFRMHLENKTDLGKLAKQFIDEGELVPDDVTVAMVRTRLQESDCDQGMLLDGFPRTLPQVDALDHLLSEMGTEISIVPYIHVSPEILLARLAGRWTCKKCGHGYHTLFNPPKIEGICDLDGSPLYQREDDTEETQKHRIKVFFEQTTPLIERYKQRELLVKVNGEQSIEDVHMELVSVIAEVSA